MTRAISTRKPKRVSLDEVRAYARRELASAGIDLAPLGPLGGDFSTERDAYEGLAAALRAAKVVADSDATSAWAYHLRRFFIDLGPAAAAWVDVHSRPLLGVDQPAPKIVARAHLLALFRFVRPSPTLRQLALMSVLTHADWTPRHDAQATIVAEAETLKKLRQRLRREGTP